ncbi:hypothetical protein ACFOEP_12995 [Microbacterium amylolyticum]|uniref:hypothetical protein n=1 Tax=Microbacterium amylolyticum TaxID=936337 RepID=UPI0036061A03
MTVVGIASSTLDYARIPESGRTWSQSALRRRQAVTHVTDRHKGLDVNDAGTLDELRRHLPRWPGRDQMLLVIDRIIDHPVITSARGRKIGRDGLRAIWINDVIDAAQSGGLLRTTNRVAAIRAGYKGGDAAVQLARSIGKKAGLYVELYRGRRLTLNERLTLWNDHDRHKQQGFPSVFAMGVFTPQHAAQFTAPKAGQFAELRSVDFPQQNDATPPLRSSSFFDLTHVLQMVTSSAADAAGKPMTTKKCRLRKKPRAGLGLAVELLADPMFATVFAGVRPADLLDSSSHMNKAAGVQGADRRAAPRSQHAARKPVGTCAQPVCAPENHAARRRHPPRHRRGDVRGTSPSTAGHSPGRAVRRRRLRRPRLDQQRH